MSVEDALRDETERRHRLDEEWLHLFSLPLLAAALRAEESFATNQQNGLTLLKEEPLRIVLEVLGAGREIREHSVAGSAVAVVIEGSVALEVDDEQRVAHGGEMLVVPHDRPRTLRALEESAVLLAVAPRSASASMSR